MVEGARLESVFRGNSNEGSNPSLSATRLFTKSLSQVHFTVIVAPICGWYWVQVVSS